MKQKGWHELPQLTSVNTEVSFSSLSSRIQFLFLWDDEDVCCVLNQYPEMLALSKEPVSITFVGVCVVILLLSFCEIPFLF